MNGLKTIREAKGWSQVKLSMRSGVAQTMISAIERGKRNSTVRILSKLAKALGCKLDDLIDMEG